MNTTDIVKGGINFFIIICVMAAFVEDIWFNPKLHQAPAAGENELQVNETISFEGKPQIMGMTIYVSDKLRKQVEQLLQKEQYNIKVENYKFEGSQWWYETILSYGHIAIVYWLLSGSNTENNISRKKYGMIGGGVVILLWVFVMPQFKINRVTLEIDGRNVYTNQDVVEEEMTSIIADHVDFEAFVNE